MTNLGFSYSDVAFAEHRRFLNNEILELVIEDAWRAPDTGGFTLRCRILSGEQRGEQTLMTFRWKFPTGDVRPDTHAFLKAFFTKEEMMAGEMDINRIIGRRFACTSRVKGSGEKIYQNFDSFKDLGPADTGGF